MPGIAVALHVHAAVRAANREVQTVARPGLAHVELPFGREIRLAKRAPEPIFERAFVIQVVDLAGSLQLRQRGGDEHDPSLPSAWHRTRQRPQNALRLLSVTARCSRWPASESCRLSRDSAPPYPRLAAVVYHRLSTAQRRRCARPNLVVVGCLLRPAPRPE